MCCLVLICRQYVFDIHWSLDPDMVDDIPKCICRMSNCHTVLCPYVAHLIWQVQLLLVFEWLAGQIGQVKVYDHQLVGAGHKQNFLTVADEFDNNGVA